MKYQLNHKYRLCGWQGLECGLLNKETGITEFIDPQKFQHLILCNGEIELDNIVPTDNLKIYLEEGLISPAGKDTQPRTEPMYRRYNNRYIEYAHWSITGGCNFKCRHCYMDAPEHKLSDVTLDQLKEIVHQLSACGVFRVKLTGGEPLIRKDFWELVDELMAYNIVIDEVYTNGWLVSEDVLKKFEKRNLYPTINMSFDGVGWHDWMRRIPGAENAAVKAFRICDKHGFRTAAEMCVHKGNIHTIRETVKFLADLNVRKLKIGALVDTELWQKNCEDMYLTTGEFINACIEYIPQYFADGCPWKLSLSNIFRYDPEKQTVMLSNDNNCEDCGNQYLCNSARKTIYISPYGTVLPCMVATALSQKIQSEFPNMLKSDLVGILNNSTLIQFADMKTEQLFSHNDECRKCEHKNYCKGGCRIEAIRCGDTYGKDETACYLYKNALNIKIRESVENILKG